MYAHRPYKQTERPASGTCEVKGEVYAVGETFPSKSIAGGFANQRTYTSVIDDVQWPLAL